MQHNSKIIPSLKISVPFGKMAFFTTILQSGILLPCQTHTPLGVFLDSLPDFDIAYISERIQTIFLDGNALDDLEQPLSNPRHILALSAAMPGLAGAIFRRNSMCAALRTRPSQAAQMESEEETMVHLKLFNMIAQEKGAGILAMGGYFTGENLHEFLGRRPSLLQSISSIELDRQPVQPDIFLSRLLGDDQYHLKILAVDN